MTCASVARQWHRQEDCSTVYHSGRLLRYLNICSLPVMIAATKVDWQTLSYPPPPPLLCLALPCMLSSACCCRPHPCSSATPFSCCGKLETQSTSATSNVLVFMSASSAAVAFLLDGRVKLHYALVFCSAAGTASLIGLTGVGRLVKASGRPSIVVLLLAFIMTAGGLCSAVFGYMDAYQHGDAGFKSIC